MISLVGGGIGLLAVVFQRDTGQPKLPTSTIVTPPPTTETNPKPKENGPTPVVAEVSVPRGTQAEPGAMTVTLANGKRVPEWVVAERNGQRVRFRLITPGATVANAPAPFYISQTKVWNGLYRGDQKTAREEPGGVDAPAVNVTANEAAAFAASFDGGRLPSPEEWDHAAGYYDPQGQDGPVRRGGQARVRIPVPATVTGPTTDATRNQYDLADLAGNGREWTNAVLLARGRPLQTIEGAAFSPRDLAILRGRNYTLGTPLTYNSMAYEQQEPQTQFAGVASPYTTFRIVLPAP